MLILSPIPGVSIKKKLILILEPYILKQLDVFGLRQFFLFLDTILVPDLVPEVRPVSTGNETLEPVRRGRSRRTSYFRRILVLTFRGPCRGPRLLSVVRPSSPSPRDGVRRDASVFPRRRPSTGVTGTSKGPSRDGAEV